MLAQLSILPGCGGLGPVARAPWVEDRSLELHREVLTVAIDRTGASVEARLELRGSGAARELGFARIGHLYGDPAETFGEVGLLFKFPIELSVDRTPSWSRTRSE